MPAVFQYKQSKASVTMDLLNGSVAESLCKRGFTLRLFHVLDGWRKSELKVTEEQLNLYPEALETNCCFNKKQTLLKVKQRKITQG